MKRVFVEKKESSFSSSIFEFTYWQEEFSSRVSSAAPKISPKQPYHICDDNGGGVDILGATTKSTPNVLKKLERLRVERRRSSWENRLREDSGRERRWDRWEDRENDTREIDLTDLDVVMGGGKQPTATIGIPVATYTASSTGSSASAASDSIFSDTVAGYYYFPASESSKHMDGDKTKSDAAAEAPPTPFPSASEYTTAPTNNVVSLDLDQMAYKSASSVDSTPSEGPESDAAASGGSGGGSSCAARVSTATDEPTPELVREPVGNTAKVLFEGLGDIMDQKKRSHNQVWHGNRRRVSCP
ncbi:hypothetical protein Pelo_12751 [Pelomyxa schiedti]|nr:hypothetical protein Pelo_12751 [Pelomyxa schiedti]